MSEKCIFYRAKILRFLTDSRFTVSLWLEMVVKMSDPDRKHWFKDYKEYWGAFLLLVIAQAWLTVAQTSWPKVTWFFVFFGAYLIINLIVALIILLLTWPVRRNLDFSRYIKMLIAFSAVYFISQLIAFLVLYFER
jgi:hypothetical protein